MGLIVTLLAAQAVLADSIVSNHTPDDITRVHAWLDTHLDRTVAFYKLLHANPELSLAEEKTSAAIGDGLKLSGFEVTTGVGGFGVVAVMKNGPGPTVLIRGDMDALPIVEETGLEYASKVKVTTDDGRTIGVMHACGHDVHTAALLATGQLLSSIRDHWRGTIVLVAQPAEELGKGARMMIEDGLFERFPRPDYCIGQHVKHDLPVGWIGYGPGFYWANVDSVDVVFYGRGGHGARPHEAVDPIVAAAHFVTSVQSLVSRRLNPVEPGVITVGSIHGGSKHNIIPPEVKLQLTVRSYKAEVRQLLLDGIRQIAEDTSRTFQCPKPPIVKVLDEHTPAAFNDPDLVDLGAGVFRAILGTEHVVRIPSEMGGEDFGRYAAHLGVPGFMFRVGSISAAAYAEGQQGKPLPGLHSSTYAPVPKPTLHTAISALSNMALALLNKP
jgi:hippurate hydrolase